MPVRVNQTNDYASADALSFIFRLLDPTNSTGERELLEELASLSDTSSNRLRTRAKPQQSTSKLSIS